MTYIAGIWLTLLGVLAVPSLIISKKPEAKDMFDKIAPFQGWIGVGSAVWGLIQLIRVLTHLQVFDFSFLFGITWLLGALLQLVLGILLGFGVMKTFVSSETAKEKMDSTLAKLAPKQGTFGIAGIIVGLWTIIYLAASLPSWMRI